MGHIRLVAAVLALGFLLGGCERAPQELRIGVAMPLSGPMGEEGRSILQAAQLAAEEISRDGALIPGSRRVVTIVPADDAGDDAVAPRAAAELVQQRVPAVLGHLTSGASIAAAPTYAAGGVLQLTAATHPQYTRLGLRTTFRLVANDDMQAVALGRYAASEFRGQRFAVLDDRSVYGKSLADAVQRELERTAQPVTFRRSYDAAATDFADLVAAMRRERAGVIVTTMELPQVQALLRQLVAADLADVVVLGGDSLKVGPLPPEAAQVRKFLATTPLVDVHDFGARGERFVERYRSRFKSEPADTAYCMYDAVYLLAQAAVQARSTDPAALALALRSLDPTLPVREHLRFADNGEPSFGAISLYAAERGRWRLVLSAAQW